MNLAPLLCAILFSTPLEREVDFATQIMPILTKAGCNAGACHGAAAGRGGFHLSLLGGDADADYEAIAQQYEGRRVDLAKPGQSLLLTKPTGYLDHGGEVRLDTDGPEAKRIRQWISAGAPRGAKRKLTKLVIIPAQKVVELGGEPIPLRAMASFDLGAMEEVTSDVLFTSTDPLAVVVNSQGLTAEVKRSGQLIVIARYLDRVVPIEFLVPFPTKLAPDNIAPAENFVDKEVFKTLQTLRIPASGPASDAEFLRRVSFDLTGRLPSVELAREFPADPRSDKRQKLVDSLLQSEAFADYWTLRFARMLRLHSLPHDENGVARYALWLKAQLQDHRPWNETVAELLTATGNTHEVGPANFARMVNDARGHAELVGRVFLGVRLECANCHNHPLDRWTQDDFHGFAAVFAKLDRSEIVKVTPHGAVTNLRTGEPAIPRIPGARNLSGDTDHRAEVAVWLTDSGDRQFARATVNRVWQAVMGRGLVEPVDDMRETNPPTHPALLAQLANDFADHGYNLRHTLKLIVLSRAYGLSHSALPNNAADDRFYSHALAKPLMAEILSDAVSDVLGVFNEFPEPDAPIRAVSAINPLTPAASLNILGRCNRVGGCETTGASEQGLAAQLHFLNGEFLNKKLAFDKNRLQILLGQGKSNDEIVEAFFWHALSREPTTVERHEWVNKLSCKDETERRERVEDFVWAILSSRAFTENQ